MSLLVVYGPYLKLPCRLEPLRGAPANPNEVDTDQVSKAAEAGTKLETLQKKHEGAMAIGTSGRQGAGGNDQVPKQRPTLSA